MRALDDATGRRQSEKLRVMHPKSGSTAGGGFPKGLADGEVAGLAGYIEPFYGYCSTGFDRYFEMAESIGRLAAVNGKTFALQNLECQAGYYLGTLNADGEP